MAFGKVYRAIGLMSGTSLDGEIDVALLETDGQAYVKPLGFYAHSYDPEIAQAVRACFGKRERDAQLDEAERLVTDIHIEAVKASGFQADLIGFHGQTITHDPDAGFTWQIGDGARLAGAVGISVVADMRQGDIKAGGQGAPLLPLYHKAMMAGQDKPVAVLNLGGVANITYIDDDHLIAFDCGPANALMDDCMRERTGLAYDEGGAMASRGDVLEAVVKDFLRHDYFKKPPPKSLDRNAWSIDCVRYARREDAMATLMEMSVSGVCMAMKHLPQKPARIYAAGGGRHNLFMLDSLSERLELPVRSIDDLGWRGDATEAEGFAYLAVRSRLGLPLTLPSTTGVREAMTGGIFYNSHSEDLEV